MHPSSYENMQKCYDRYIRRMGYESRQVVKVIDIGGAEVNGSYRGIFSHPVFQYLTADIATEGVDFPMLDPYQVPLPNESVDIVLSGQMLEHCELFWLAFKEMMRIMKPDGFLFLIAPSSGPIHRYPVDCYRFYPDAFEALAKFANCRLEASWLDERGPWRDLVGVFRKTPLVKDLTPSREIPWVSGLSAWQPSKSADPATEICAGSMDYAEFLRHAHASLNPRGYLEIGIRHGASLVLAKCPAIGIDPLPDINCHLSSNVRIINQTSDDFFDFSHGLDSNFKIDLSFIDGMHLFEFVLRDFMHLERLSPPTGVILIDDIFPNHPLQSSRERQTRVWTGDVWKIKQCLKAWRPDLFLLALDTWPTGTLLVAGLDPGNRSLWDNYNPIVKTFRDRYEVDPPEDVLTRKDAIYPGIPLLEAIFSRLFSMRMAGVASPSDLSNELMVLLAGFSSGDLQ